LGGCGGGRRTPESWEFKALRRKGRGLERGRWEKEKRTDSLHVSLEKGAKTTNNTHPKKPHKKKKKKTQKKKKTPTKHKRHAKRPRWAKASGMEVRFGHLVRRAQPGS